MRIVAVGALSGVDGGSDCTVGDGILHAVVISVDALIGIKVDSASEESIGIAALIKLSSEGPVFLLFQNVSHQVVESLRWVSTKASFEFLILDTIK